MCLSKPPILLQSSLHDSFTTYRVAEAMAGICLLLVADSVHFPAVCFALSGFQYSGVMVNHVDIAPQYAGVLFGISNTAATLPGIAAPYVIGVITSNVSRTRTRARPRACARAKTRLQRRTNVCTLARPRRAMHTGTRTHTRTRKHVDTYTRTPCTHTRTHAYASRNKQEQ